MSVRTSSSLLVAFFVMASWIALLCEARCLVPGSLHGEPGQSAAWSSVAGPAPQKHHQPVPSQVKLCILALPGTFLSAQTLSSREAVEAIPAKVNDRVSAEVLARPRAFSQASFPLFYLPVSPNPASLVLRI